MNLPEVLLNDYLLMRDSLQGTFIEVLSEKVDLALILERENPTILLCPPDAFASLDRLAVDLFVNIASMQEMTQESIDAYFSIIRKSEGERFFYCANRREKSLPDGEKSEFLKYGWKIEDEAIDAVALIPWHREFYQMRPKFIQTFDGEHVHTLAKMASWSPTDRPLPQDARSKRDLAKSTT